MPIRSFEPSSRRTSEDHHLPSDLYCPVPHTGGKCAGRTFRRFRCLRFALPFGMTWICSEPEYMKWESTSACPCQLPRRRLRAMDLGHDRNSVFLLRIWTINQPVTHSFSI